jgi:hypothetical protein
VAEEFRRQMTNGQTMKEHNMFRMEFYNNVIRIAKRSLLGPKWYSSPNFDVSLAEYTARTVKGKATPFICRLCKQQTPP